MNNVFVGEDIILPRSLRSQNALPPLAESKISISFVGTGVLDGPMSHRSQIAYLSIAKIKIIYGNNIFTFCFRTAEDVGPYNRERIFYRNLGFHRYLSRCPEVVTIAKCTSVCYLNNKSISIL